MDGDLIKNYEHAKNNPRLTRSSFIEEETQAQVFSSEFVKFLRTTFLQNSWAIASD